MRTSLPAILPGPEITKAETKLDSTLRGYCIHEGMTYRYAFYTLEIKPRKFQTRYFVDLSKPYNPR